MPLRDDFNAAVLAAVAQCYAIGYTPHRFEQMINVQHPVEVGKNLVVSGEFQHGFRELKKLNRLDLAIESIMLDPNFASLFSKQELAAARWRLANV